MEIDVNVARNVMRTLLHPHAILADLHAILGKGRKRMAGVRSI